MMRKLVLVLCVIGVVSVPVFATADIFNGGFEENFDGWMADGFTSVVTVANLQDGSVTVLFEPKADEKMAAVGMGGGSIEINRISQTVTLKNGDETLRFAFNVWTYDEGSGNIFAVLVNGSPEFSVNASGIGDTLIGNLDFTGWQWGTIDLSSFNPGPVFIEFKAGSDPNLSLCETCPSGVFLDEIQILTDNEPPDCSQAYPSAEILWPPNHRFAEIEVLGVTDPDGDDVTITIDSIFQDEPVDAKGSGRTAPDGRGVGSSIAEVRAERVGSGNGRVYHIGFTADDGFGGTCSAEVLVGVPKSQGKKWRTPVDDGPLYDSTIVP
jgi:hypothetical protein